jgi:hypothetical protein
MRFINIVGEKVKAWIVASQAPRKDPKLVVFARIARQSMLINLFTVTHKPILNFKGVYKKDRE